MNIKLHEILIKDLYENFIDKGENGVYGYDDKLSIREPYQREFVYDNREQAAVIDSVMHDFPIGVMYWMVKPDGTYGVLDGQQRTLSICHFLDGDFSIEIDGTPRFFDNLAAEKKNQLLNYKLLVYFCDGTEDERLAWFRTINIAGKELTQQELRNAAYVGPWIMSAKKTFSKTACYAYNLGANYLKGSCIRQDYLEKVLFWAASSEDKSIEEYMAEHQNDADATPLKDYFTDIIDWVESLFDYDSSMKGVEWGLLYNKYHNKKYDATALKKRVKELQDDDEITKASGIYEYLLAGERDEKLLSLRVFPLGDKKRQYAKQGGICPVCGKKFELDEMHADHIIPWSQGGKTVPDNLQMLCSHCNLMKKNDTAKFI